MFIHFSLKAYKKATHWQSFVKVYVFLLQISLFLATLERHLFTGNTNKEMPHSHSTQKNSTNDYDIYAYNQPMKGNAKSILRYNL